MSSIRNALQKAAAPVRRARRNSDVQPVEGFNAAHSDLIAFLARSHGDIFDKVMTNAENLGLKREQVSYIFCGLVALYLIFGSAARLMCNLIGFGYPMYASVKAIRTHDTDDDTRWLVYWTCFAVLCLFDFFSEGIFRLFPFYFILKAIFLIYLYLPQTQGSIVFYEKVVDPLVTKIDELVAKW
ncbi:unnamed protein product [Caenorhabditis bovis]|uniref:Receptor expression-enhancing protein n=1 Tax=Caenorhabditis bovis TaxID=2654633 RepID=A0A8S1E8I6_9PELO|nr:unnamed protein product [Caenorhabditis bovis]